MERLYLLLNVSDNANYGDLLFPIILTHFIREGNPRAEIKNYAPVESDWSSFGGVPTSSYRSFVRACRENPEAFIIVGGGGLFNTAWHQLVWRLGPSFRKAFAHRQIRRVMQRLNAVRRVLSQVPVHLPFVLSHRCFQDAYVFYNSVGGFPMDHRALDQQDVIHLCRQKTFLSVRDHTLASDLKPFKVPTNLVPDSALIMSDLFPLPVLKGKVGKVVRGIVEDSEYICLQLGTGLGPQNLEGFLETLLGEAGDLKILLCPIKYRITGRVGDEQVLASLAEKYPKLVFFSPESVYETMYAIASSKGFLGTSLHGFITAYSFGLPGFGFSDVDKLKAYIETWADPIENLIDPDSATGLVERIENYDHEKAIQRVAVQKEMVYKNLARLRDFSSKN